MGLHCKINASRLLHCANPLIAANRIYSRSLSPNAMIILGVAVELKSTISKGKRVVEDGVKYAIYVRI